MSILLALNPGMRRRKWLSINVSVLVLTVRILKADLVSLLVLSLCVESLKHSLIDLLMLLLEDRDKDILVLHMGGCSTQGLMTLFGLLLPGMEWRFNRGLIDLLNLLLLLVRMISMVGLTRRFGCYYLVFIRILFVDIFGFRIHVGVFVGQEAWRQGAAVLSCCMNSR